MNRRLKLLLAAAALAGVWSVWIESRHGGEGSALMAEARPIRNVTMANPTTIVSAPDAEEPPRRGAFESSAQSDAFAMRNWQPAPAAPTSAASQAVAPKPVAPPAPVLPYKYIGLLQDPVATKPRVFLSIGDRLIVASPGDVLEGGYRLESITADELVFIHVQQGAALRLSVAGVPS